MPRNMSLWLDFKNLRDSNVDSIASLLLPLLRRHDAFDRVYVESGVTVLSQLHFAGVRMIFILRDRDLDRPEARAALIQGAESSSAFGVSLAWEYFLDDGVRSDFSPWAFFTYMINSQEAFHTVRSKAGCQWVGVTDVSVDELDSWSRTESGSGSMEPTTTGITAPTTTFITGTPMSATTTIDSAGMGETTTPALTRAGSGTAAVRGGRVVWLLVAVVSVWSYCVP